MTLRLRFAVSPLPLGERLHSRATTTLKPENLGIVVGRTPICVTLLYLYSSSAVRVVTPCLTLSVTVSSYPACHGFILDWPPTCPDAATRRHVEVAARLRVGAVHGGESAHCGVRWGYTDRVPGRQGGGEGPESAGMQTCESSRMHHPVASAPSHSSLPPRLRWSRRTCGCSGATWGGAYVRASAVDPSGSRP